MYNSYLKHTLRGSVIICNPFHFEKVSLTINICSFKAKCLHDEVRILKQYAKLYLFHFHISTFLSIRSCIQIIDCLTMNIDYFELSVENWLFLLGMRTWFLMPQYA